MRDHRPSICCITLDRDGHIVSTNQLAREYIRATFGRPPELGESFASFAAEDTIEDFSANFRRARDGESVSTTRRLRYPSGLELVWHVHYEPVSIANEVRYVLFLGSEITESTLREDAARVYRGMFAQSSTAFVLCDARDVDMPILHTNAAFETLTGYEGADLIGRNCRFLQGSDRGQKAAFQLRVAISRGEPCEVVLSNYRRDGTRFRNRVSIWPVRDESGVVTHYAGTMRDEDDPRER